MPVRKGAATPTLKAPHARKRVTSWLEYQTVIEPYLNGKWLFRGVTNVRLPLVPSVGRGIHFAYSAQTEKALLDQFKREALPLLPSRPHDNWEWLALAQHFGVPTRLLDWSETPYVSLFFAVSGQDNMDAGLYVVPKPDDEPPPRDPFKAGKPFFFYPGYVTPRLVSQRGLFTIHPRPNKEYLPANMLQITIDCRCKPDFRRKLDAVGVHEAAIYADLDSLSRRLVTLQGNKATATAPVPDEAARLKAIAGLPPAPKLNPNDPQKGQWGGRPENGGWRLSAKVREISEDWYEIVLTVAPATPGKRLSGSVKFHLHDTFLHPVQKATAREGKAVLRVAAYGAFTVGALVERDGTVLELDLAQVESAPRTFRER